MLYFIGGPGRVGKTTLATRLMREKGVPFIPADILTHALDETYPQLNIRSGGWATIPERWYPFLEKVAANAVRAAPDYCIEGDSFLPEHVARLNERFGLRACFLGNSCITLETMIEHAGHNDWVRLVPEAEQKALAGEIIEISLLFERESAGYGFPYVDVRTDFEAALDAAFGFLAGQ